MAAKDGGGEGPDAWWQGGHLGRLAAILGKQVLLGQKVVFLHYEETNMSGSFYRNKLKCLAFFSKHMNTNSSRSPATSNPPAASSGGHCKTRCPSYQARPGHSGLSWGILWDPTTLWQEKSEWWFLPSSELCQIVQTNTHVQVCLPRLPGSQGWLEVLVSSSHTGEEKEEQHPLLEKNFKKQLMRLQKQAEKNIEKKTDKWTEVLKTPG